MEDSTYDTICCSETLRPPGQDAHLWQRGRGWGGPVCRHRRSRHRGRRPDGAHSHRAGPGHPPGLCGPGVRPVWPCHQAGAGARQQGGGH